MASMVCGLRNKTKSALQEHHEYFFSFFFFFRFDLNISTTLFLFFSFPSLSFSLFFFSVCWQWMFSLKFIAFEYEWLIICMLFLFLRLFSRIVFNVRSYGLPNSDLEQRKNNKKGKKKSSIKLEITDCPVCRPSWSTWILGNFVFFFG